MRWSTVIFLALAAPCCKAVTPVEKVINLLEKLETEAQDEGVTEATEYDKYACWCKAQADAKILNIATCEAAIEKAAAKIKKLQGEIAEASGDLADGNTRVGEIKQEMEDEQKIRDDAHHEYTIKHADVASACTSVEEAIDQMEAKSVTEGGAFVQLSTGATTKVANVLRKAIMDNALEATDKQMDFIGSFLETSARQDPAAAKMAVGFAFHSGEIFDNLREILRKFKKKKSEVETAEEEKKHTFNMAQAARASSLRAQEDACASLEETIARKEEESSQISTQKEETENDQTTDQTFLEALTDECEKQAKTWDQRSKARSKELMALAEALTILKDKVAGTYSANKKLNLIKAVSQAAATTQAPAMDAAKATKIEEKRKELLAEKAKIAKQEQELQELEGGPKIVSFLQTSGPDAAAKKVVQFLTKQSKKLDSPVLATLVMKMKADHFAKIRGMIKDLIAKLESSAEEEESQKAWCDDEMEKATAKRDEAIGNVEADLAAITETKAKIDEAVEEVDLLEVEIAALYKNVNEATTLRKAESAENSKTLKNAKIGLSAIKAATAVLKDFYDNAFIQKSSQPVADSDGKTIGDMAPKVASEEYGGKQDAAAGILGMMAVIQSDFEGTIEATEAEEKEAKEEHDKFVSDSEGSIDEKKDLSKTKNGDIKTLESDLVEYKDDLKDHAGLKGDALEELAKLKPPCVSTGASYEEKVKRREQEIESLKDAYKIFAEMTLTQISRHN